MAEFVLTESKSDFSGDESSFKKREFQKIPEDLVLDATVEAVEERDHPFFKDDDGNPQRTVNFTFALEGEEYGKNRRLWGETPTTFTTHPDCKLRSWTQEILGGNELDVGFKLNTDALVGAKVRVVVGYEEWDSKRNPGTRDWKNSIKDVIHSRSSVGAFDQVF